MIYTKYKVHKEIIQPIHVNYGPLLVDEVSIATKYDGSTWESNGYSALSWTHAQAPKEYGL